MGREQYVGSAMYPVSSTGMILDVLDSQDRYVIVEPGKPIERTLSLQPIAVGSPSRISSPVSPLQGLDSLAEPSGSGELPYPRSLVTETSYYFVHPLFWKPYDKPVLGETDIVIGSSVTTTGRSR